MAIIFVVVGIIAALIYSAVTDNGNNAKAGAVLIVGVLFIGCILEAIYGNLVGLIIIFILFAGWVFSQ